MAHPGWDKDPHRGNHPVDAGLLLIAAAITAAIIWLTIKVIAGS